MIFVLTGRVHSGKTTLIKKVIVALKKKGYNFSGILSEAVFKEGKNIGYDAIALNSGKRFPLLRRRNAIENDFDIGKNIDGTEAVGAYYLLSDGKRGAEEAILNRKPGDLTVIDEIGPLELRERKGLWGTAAKLFKEKQGDIMVVVRDKLLDEFLLVIRDREKKVFSIEEENV